MWVQLVHEIFGRGGGKSRVTRSYIRDCGHTATSSVRRVPTLPCIASNRFVRSADDNVEEVESLFLQFCQEKTTWASIR
jgi:hypothetical protein